MMQTSGLGERGGMPALGSFGGPEFLMQAARERRFAFDTTDGNGSMPLPATRLGAPEAGEPDGRARGATASGTHATLLGEATPTAQARAREVAAQFEAIFVQQMVSAMRASAEGLGGGMFEGSGSDTYAAWFDRCMAEHIGKDRGIGLAEIVAQDILRHSDAAGPAADASDVMPPTSLPLPLRSAAAAGAEAHRSVLEAVHA